MAVPGMGGAAWDSTFWREAAEFDKWATKHGYPYSSEKENHFLGDWIELRVSKTKPNTFNPGKAAIHVQVKISESPSPHEMHDAFAKGKRKILDQARSGQSRTDLWSE